MIQLSITDMIRLGSMEQRLLLIPQTGRELLNAFALQLDPKAVAKHNEQIEAAAEALGQEPDVLLPTPSDDGTFDRTGLAVFADWLKENGETSLERACRFLVKHTDIRIIRYGGNWWRFEESTMPKRWNGNIGNYSDTLPELLCALAKEIDERLAAIGV